MSVFYLSFHHHHHHKFYEIFGRLSPGDKEIVFATIELRIRIRHFSLWMLLASPRFNDIRQVAGLVIHSFAEVYTPLSALYVMFVSLCNCFLLLCVMPTETN